MKKYFVLVPLAVLLSFSAWASQNSQTVSNGEVGIGQSGALVVAEKGSVVYARKGSNVQYWPGSTLIPLSKATVPVPKCDSATVTASGNKQELIVVDGASACTAGDASVVAFTGSIVIYEPDVDLIRRPVRRK